MNRKQIYICSAIFIALTLVRFTSPALADRISDGISRALYIEQEHTETAVEFGKSLAEGDVIETFFERFDKNAPAQPVAAESTPTPTPTAAPVPEQTPARHRSRPNTRQLRRFWPLRRNIRSTKFPKR